MNWFEMIAIIGGDVVVTLVFLAGLMLLLWAFIELFQC